MVEKQSLLISGSVPLHSRDATASVVFSDGEYLGTISPARDVCNIKVVISYFLVLCKKIVLILFLHFVIIIISFQNFLYLVAVDCIYLDYLLLCYT